MNSENTTVLATAYAVNPFKGSEDGMGWNFIMQIARYRKVIAITRENNETDINAYMDANPSPVYENVSFKYYDLPYYLRFWKKGSRGAMLYYFLWQLLLPGFVRKHDWSYGITHNLNFHNDWTPSFLWRLNKPFIWGPVGHHPKIPKQYLLPTYGLKSYVKDRFIWMVKNFFWHLDPFLKMSRKKADQILVMNTASRKTLKSQQHKARLMPSVATEYVNLADPIPKEKFRALSVGRFVPLKGFDLTLKSFAAFYKKLSLEEQKKVELILVGKGSYFDAMKVLAEDLKISSVTRIIPWIKREQLDAIYRDASVFLFPSHEGAGMVVAEAFSYGLPVVSLDNSGPGEFLSDDTGIRVPHGSYDATVNGLANAVNSLFKSEILRKSKSESARNRYEELFDWNVKGDQLDQLYENLPNIS